jgi:hypothetical protein
MMTFTASAELSEVGNTFTPKWLDMTMKATSFSGSNIQVLADSMTTFFFFFKFFCKGWEVNLLGTTTANDYGAGVEVGRRDTNSRRQRRYP